MALTYEEFIETEGIPVLRTFALSDMASIEVAPWDRVGGMGSYVLLDGRGPAADAFVTEIGPSKELKEQRHLFEEMVFVVSGSGRTELWNDAGFHTAFNWERGAMFTIPLNVHFKHINRDSNTPARLFSVTNAPVALNFFKDPDFIFNCEQDFEERFNPELSDYSKPAMADGSTSADGRAAFTGSLVPSAYDIPLVPAEERGKGNIRIGLNVGAAGGHISQFPPRTYKKAHRHGPGAHVILLSGAGYSLLWHNEDEEPIRVDWQSGTVIVPPDRFFHQNFNTGSEPARYLAIYGGAGVINDGDHRDAAGRFLRLMPTREGGDQIEYEDEDPKIKAMFEADLIQHP